jgi:uncharacterized protein (TIGR02145 family)
MNKSIISIKKINFFVSVLVIFGSEFVIGQSKDSVSFNSKIEYGVVSDKEGNSYKTVLIDNKTWLAENLRVTKYKNGDPIETTEKNKDISKDVEPKYYWKFEGSDSISSIYGNLYTWYVVQDPRGVCPDGFRIPTDKDWVSLINSLDGNIVAGAKLKEVDFNHWMKPNANATNETGFTGLPGGYRENDGKYYVLGFRGYWWSSKNNYVSIVWNSGLMYNYDILERLDFVKKNGLSVRCVK